MKTRRVEIRSYVTVLLSDGDELPADTTIPVVVPTIAVSHEVVIRDGVIEIEHLEDAE